MNFYQRNGNNSSFIELKIILSVYDNTRIIKYFLKK